MCIRELVVTKKDPTNRITPHTTLRFRCWNMNEYEVLNQWISGVPILRQCPLTWTEVNELLIFSTLPSANQTWLAGKWTLLFGDFPS